jgi:probable O-glycosylation ligase (exosortase A-associated)
MGHLILSSLTTIANTVGRYAQDGEGQGMKQLALLSAATILGAIGAIQTPFWGVLLYYSLAVLRPQHLWDWALDGNVRWSLMAAMITLVSFWLHLSRIITRSAFNGMVTLIIGYALLVMFSTIMAFNPQIAQGWAIEYAKVLIIAVVASMVIEHFWQIKVLALMILLMLGYIAWEINFLYFFRGGRLNIFHYGYGGLDNNGAGLLLAMGIPFAYCFAMGPARGIWRWWPAASALIGLILIHAVMMTYSRGAMLASAVGILWVLIHHRPRWQSAGAAIALVLVLSVMAGPEISSRFFSTANFRTDASAQSRFGSWAAAWQMAWENPILGKGIRNSNQYSQNYGADKAGRTIHNQYLQIAADTGIPAATLYLGMLGFGMWNFRRARMMCRDTLASDDADDLDAYTKHRIQHASYICLAAQASLVIFIFDGMFLSLEMFETPWLLLGIAGVLPKVMRSHLDSLIEAHKAEAATDRENKPKLSGITHGWRKSALPASRMTDSTL